jgi:hypothetical protein
MKKIILLTMCLVLIGAGAALADQTFTNDTQFKGSDGLTYQYPTVIGDFNLFGTSWATLTDAGIFTITTNWNPGKEPYYGAYTAFLFIETGGNEYAIDLDTLTGTGTVDKNPSSGKTSQDFSWPGTYGQWLADGTTPIPVQASGGTTSTTSVIWTYGSGNLDNTVAVDLSGILTTESWEVLWGTATSGNGTFQGGSDIGVPLPPSALLLSTGLLGLAGLGWRRRKKS